MQRQNDGGIGEGVQQEGHSPEKNQARLSRWSRIISWIGKIFKSDASARDGVRGRKIPPEDRLPPSLSIWRWIVLWFARLSMIGAIGWLIFVPFPNFCESCCHSSMFLLVLSCLSAIPIRIDYIVHCSPQDAGP